MTCFRMMDGSTVSSHLKKIGVPYSSIYELLDSGIDIYSALSHYFRRKGVRDGGAKYHLKNGKKVTDYCKYNSPQYGKFYRELKKNNLSVDEAFEKSKGFISKKTKYVYNGKKLSDTFDYNTCSLIRYYITKKNFSINKSVYIVTRKRSIHDKTFKK